MTELHINIQNIFNFQYKTLLLCMSVNKSINNFILINSLDLYCQIHPQHKTDEVFEILNLLQMTIHGSIQHDINRLIHYKGFSII